jgi:hypothetical protein
MKRNLITVVFTFCAIILSAQNLSDFSSANFNEQVLNSSAVSLPLKDTINIPDFKLKNQDASFGRKFSRGFLLSVALNTCSVLGLMIEPDYMTKWFNPDKFKIAEIEKQYIRSFTRPPAFDKDLWYINYVLHPYHGAYFYNNIRSQGATIWQSAFYSLLQSTLWEYVWEGGFEQPSIQDLIVTPIAGSILGELSNRATLQMRKNGFEWYEKVLVCIINPSYAINNGFKTHKIPGL